MQTIIMKMIPFISVGLLCWTLTAGAQGFVHLTAGDTLTIEFNGVDGCHPSEGGLESAVNVVFITDLLDPGESLKLEVFENSLSDPPFASQTFSPATSVPATALYGPTAWQDYQGLVRISMLSGSVDVVFADFFVGQVVQYCDAVVVVPEPSSAWLILLGGGALFYVRRTFHH